MQTDIVAAIEKIHARHGIDSCLEELPAGVGSGWGLLAQQRKIDARKDISFITPTAYHEVLAEVRALDEKGSPQHHGC